MAEKGTPLLAPLIAVFLASAVILAPARPARADGDCPAGAAPGGEGCARAMLRLGRADQSTAHYAEAAETYERFSALYPHEVEAPTALSDAVILRLGLGDAVAATKDIVRFRETWGATRRTESAQLELALALHHAEHGERDRARATVRGAMDRLDHAPIDLGIRAHALAATLSETPLGAHEEHAKVLAAWSDPEAAEGALRRARPAETDAQLDRRLARVLNAVGAARIFVADERRHAEVESVKLPAGRMLVPGCITHASVIVEHPDLVAERIVKVAKIVGRERVMASSDCGFASTLVPGQPPEIEPEIVWAKFGSLAEGARRATMELWG